MTSFMQCGCMHGQYGCIQGPIWVHVRADMSSHERAVMGLEQSWGQLHANVIDYNYNYFEIS